MTEKLRLPDPAPKGCEHEKWKAMVDSVIEFISASRAMLLVLNERIKMNERIREEEEKRLEDEKTKLAFYKECLHLGVKPVTDSKKETVDSGTFQTMKECGDYNANMTAVEKVDQNFDVNNIKDEKDCGTDNISTNTRNVKKSNVREKQHESPQNTNGNIPNANTPTSTSTEAKINKISTHTECRRHPRRVDNISKEMQSAHIEHASKEIQHSPDEKDANAALLVEHKDILHTSCSSQSDYKLTKCKRKAALENANKTTIESDVKSVIASSKGLSSQPSGDVPTKCPRMASRIPRTKSYVENKSKCMLIEGASVSNTQCQKRCQKEVTYRTIHQRNKSPRGDSVAQL